MQFKVPRCPQEIHTDLTWQIQRRPSLLLCHIPWFTLRAGGLYIWGRSQQSDSRNHWTCKEDQYHSTDSRQLRWNQGSILDKKSLFTLERQPLQTISPQSSEITACLAELTLEETNYTLQFQKIPETLFPALSNLARKSSALTASSALVEQVLSILGRIHRPERARAHE